MNEISFKLKGGKFLVICRLDNENKKWTAILVNTATYKSKILLKGRESGLKRLIATLIEADNNSLLKEEQNISILIDKIKKIWKVTKIN